MSVTSLSRQSVVLVLTTENKNTHVKHKINNRKKLVVASASKWFVIGL